MAALRCRLMVFFFFFQAEDGIRDTSVTGVQTCALPISSIQSLRAMRSSVRPMWKGTRAVIARNARSRSGKWQAYSHRKWQIGRASCREREYKYVEKALGKDKSEVGLEVDLGNVYNGKRT